MNDIELAAELENLAKLVRGSDFFVEESNISVVNEIERNGSENGYAKQKLTGNKKIYIAINISKRDEIEEQEGE